MPNNLDSNITQKVAEVFTPAFEKMRVLSKTVNTQLLDSQGLGTPRYGDTMRFKRQHQYRATETPGGDISAVSKNDIISGTSVGTVQNFITVPLEFENIDQAIKMNQLEEMIRPAAEECVTRLETNLGNFMIQNAGLMAGTPGNAVNAWGDVASGGSLLNAIGVPMSGERYSAMNPYSVQNLADAQAGLSSGSDSLVNTAWQNAQISSNFGGLRGLMSNSLSNYQAGALAGSSGTLAATPVSTYESAKDSMQQTLTLTGLTISTDGALRAGDVLEFTGTGALARSFIHLKTRQSIVGADGGAVNWTCTVLEDADTDGSGETQVVVSSAAIYEVDGQYNRISAPLTSGDAFVIKGAADAIYQPNLFYHKEAFGVGFVELPKLYSTDTIIETSDGISIRVSKYSDGDANQQKIRFDLVPAFATFDPLFAGKFFGA